MLVAREGRGVGAREERGVGVEMGKTLGVLCADGMRHPFTTGTVTLLAETMGAGVTIGGDVRISCG